MAENLPTARSMLPQRYLRLDVWCEACQHSGAANMQAIIDAGQGGDQPLKDMRFRCAKCGSQRTDAVVVGMGGIGVSRGVSRSRAGKPSFAEHVLARRGPFWTRLSWQTLAAETLRPPFLVGRGGG